MKLSDILKKRNSIYDEDEEEAYEEETTVASSPVASEKPISSAVGADKGNGIGTLQMQIKRPQSFEEVTEVADCLKCGQTVVLNLEELETSEAKRMMDYLAGVLYAVDGKLDRSSSKTFVLTPNSVNVASEGKARLHPEK